MLSLSLKLIKTKTKTKMNQSANKRKAIFKKNTMIKDYLNYVNPSSAGSINKFCASCYINVILDSLYEAWMLYDVI